MREKNFGKSAGEFNPLERGTDFETLSRRRENGIARRFCQREIKRSGTSIRFDLHEIASADDAADPVFTGLSIFINLLVTVLLFRLMSRPSF